MRNRRGRISAFREVGSALAVLAVWALTLLAPLHQTSSLMRELAARGHEAAVVWTLCNPADADPGDPDQAAVVCPLQGIGKLGLIPPMTGIAEIELLPPAHMVWDQIRARPPDGPAPHMFAQSRAPPAFS
ncbi:hypothetical protein [Neomegalonema sp.]|uniref:hypothetical protein n=1 Tax=Neomegalonema sp. TaxID=2039713 RepID=UPI0026255C78|nr:hypothetical protein [Neomegalonema sp.]MDD2867364.1 hypothetical protein [Neomegalonema sp.]